MRYPVTHMRCLAPLSFIFLTCLSAQVLPVSSGPIRMGHLHIVSANPDLQKRFWTDGLGAQYVKTDAYDIYKVPGVLIVVQKGDSRSGTDDSVVNHLGLKVRDVN